jgi:hypothetical protein
MSNPQEEVARAQTGFSSGLLSQQQIKEALDLYARAVEFCQMKGLPLDCIRIEAQANEFDSIRSGGSITEERTPVVTVLRFNGSHWLAARVATFQLHPQLEKTLVRGYLSLSLLDSF